MFFFVRINNNIWTCTVALFQFSQLTRLVLCTCCLQRLFIQFGFLVFDLCSYKTLVSQRPPATVVCRTCSPSSALVQRREILLWLSSVSVHVIPDAWPLSAEDNAGGTMCDAGAWRLTPDLSRAPIEIGRLSNKEAA